MLANTFEVDKINGNYQFYESKYLDLTLLKVTELMQMDFTEEEMQVCILDKYGARFQMGGSGGYMPLYSNTLILSCFWSYAMIWFSKDFHLEILEAQHTQI